MAEDISIENPIRSTVIGLSTDDIITSVYEGGFKTWECSEDLASYIFSVVDATYRCSPREHHIIEVNDRLFYFDTHACQS